MVETPLSTFTAWFVSWGAVSLLAGILIGIAFSVLGMNPAQFLVAEVCFIASGILSIGRVGWWLAVEQSQASLIHRGMLTVVLLGAISVLTVEVVAWTERLRINGRLKLVFSDSPFLTEQRQRFISSEIDGTRAYLSDIGFAVPPMVPPIQVSSRGGMIGGPSDYGYTILMQVTDLDDRLSVRSHYLHFAFDQMLGVGKIPIDEDPYTGILAGYLATYFTSSYSNTDFSAHRGWDAILWRLRTEIGANMLDHALFFTVKLLDQVKKPPKVREEGQATWTISSDAIDEYMKLRVERGLMVMDNPGQTWKPKLDRIIVEVRSAEATSSSSEGKQ